MNRLKMMGDQSENVPSTGKAPEGMASHVKFEQKDFVYLWFIRPLEAMDNDDGIAALTLCFPLIEAIIRCELKIPDDQSVTFSDGAPALHWFAKFMHIPDAKARVVWDTFRNGLLHRAMVSDGLSYRLTGDRKGRPAKVEGDQVTIYAWDLRDAVVAKVRKLGKGLWRGTSSPLPDVFYLD